MKDSKYIDHTALKPDTTREQIIKLCREAAEHDFASVCVNACWLPVVKEELKGTDVKACTVIGFPLGAMSEKAKVFEAADAVNSGADEVDMVINVGMLKDNNDAYVIHEIKAVKEAVGDHVLKVIIETGLLNDEEKARACKDAMAAGADFVKTCTGFGTGSAAVEDIRLMKATVGDVMKVKASGGIRDRETFEKMIAAGADRIGTSSGVKLVG
jgi:deoxyribose-phosphate aldolase